jgi:hypothetical protein
MKAKKRQELETEVEAWIHEGRLKDIGGSMSDVWNINLADETARTLWFFDNSDAEEIEKQQRITIGALRGIKPSDVLEGMIAAQVIACHHAAMECYRRAMIPDQSFEWWRESLNQANKLSRTYTTLLEGLNRHRGKGQQKVTVEHIHIHDGGQAIVGTVEAPGGGDTTKTKDQPHALGYAPGAKMPSTDTPADPLPVARDEERPMPNARRKVTGATEGE